MTFSDNTVTLLRWLLVILFNAVYGFMVSITMVKTPTELIAILLGVMTWYLLYVLVDLRLLKQAKHQLRRQLFFAAIVRGCLQPLMMFDLYAGILAGYLLGALALETDTALDFYLMTVVTGGILSIVCGLCLLFIKLASEFIQRRRNS